MLRLRGAGRGPGFDAAEVGVVVALDHAEPSRLDDQQMVGDAVDEVAVVADKQHRAVELAQRSLQGIAGPEVEVVGRLIEDEEIGVLGGEPGQGSAAPFAAAEQGDLLKRGVARESETGQQPAALRLVEFLVGGADRVDHVRGVVERSKLLVEVAERQRHGRG